MMVINGRYSSAIVRQFYGLIYVNIIIIIHCAPILIKYFIKLNLIYVVHDHELCDGRIYQNIQQRIFINIMTL